VIRREGDVIRDGLNICLEARCVAFQLFGIRVYVRLVKWRKLPVFQVYRNFKEIEDDES
jgi:hypothetical protein